MTVQELKKLIKEDNIPNFLIFMGEEWKVQEVYIKQIAKVRGLSKFYVEDIEEIWKSINTQSLFSENYLYLLRDDKQLLTNEKVYSRIDSVLGENMLILTLTSPDKRLKMLKQYKDRVVEFEALKTDILKSYIQKEIDLSDRNCEILMEVCDYNYGHCLLEINKMQDYINSYTHDRPKPDEVFNWFLKDGTIYIPPRDVIWDFIKAFLQNRPLLAYELYQELKELETPTFSILSNLYNNTRALFQVQTCKSGDIEKSTGLTSWQIRNAKECLGKISTGDLAYLMRLIQKVETSIKQGKIEEVIAIDYIFTNFY